jgi:hypothetical protein
VARLLIETYSKYQYVALVRKDEDISKVAAMFPRIRIVKGRLEDREIIMKESANAKIILRMSPPVSYLIYHFSPVVLSPQSLSYYHTTHTLSSPSPYPSLQFYDKGSKC